METETEHDTMSEGRSCAVCRACPGKSTEVLSLSHVEAEKFEMSSVDVLDFCVLFSMVCVV